MMTCVAISFLIMIISVSVSSGFRHEIRTGISSVSGDVQLTRPDMNYMEEGTPIGTSPSYLSMIEELPCTESVVPAVYRAGIVKKGEDIYGIIVKGRPGRVSGTLALSVSVPESFWYYHYSKRRTQFYVHPGGDPGPGRSRAVCSHAEPGGADGACRAYSTLPGPGDENGPAVLRSGQAHQAGSGLVILHSLKEVTEARVLPGPHTEASSNCFSSSYGSLA